jgi:hypothetical protein
MPTGAAAPGLVECVPAMRNGFPKVREPAEASNTRIRAPSGSWYEWRIGSGLGGLPELNRPCGELPQGRLGINSQ